MLSLCAFIVIVMENMQNLSVSSHWVFKNGEIILGTLTFSKFKMTCTTSNMGVIYEDILNPQPRAV